MDRLFDRRDGIKRESKSDGLDKYREKLAALAEPKQVPADTRIVRLIYESACGCGHTGFPIDREVPADSPWKDGDIVDTLEEDDIVVD